MHMQHNLYQPHKLLSPVLLLLGCAASAAALADADNPLTVSPAVPQTAVKGYLAKSELPDSIALLPPPPAEGSAAMKLDEAISLRNLELRGSPRWQLAATDADVKFPGAAGTFSCALNVAISETDTPHLYTLLRRSLFDAGQSTSAAKNYYKRPRPFLINKQPICTPKEQDAYTKNAAYPSGHAAVGWAWALILAELAPEQSTALLARGRAFAESRVVCNVHWHSDVTQSLLIGAATVARLHAEPAFRADMDAARAELAAIRSKELPPVRDCKAETATLAP